MARQKQLLQIPGIGSLYGRARVALSPKRHDGKARRVVDDKGISISGLGACRPPSLC